MEQYIAEFVTISIMAFALGMDAFSVGLGMGMTLVNNREIFKIGLIVGAFHALMPFLGIVLGKIFSTSFSTITTITSGLLLIGLGIHMSAFSVYSDKNEPGFPIGFGLIVFAMSVSIDSFSVGLSFGMIGIRSATILIIFGLAAMVMCWSGLMLGRKFHRVLGIYSRILGGCILILFGLKIIFGY